jgi:predicted nucleotidyltransferase
MELIGNYIGSLTELCNAYNVDKMYLFGSALNSNFNVKSDIDFLVKFKNIELSKYFDNYIPACGRCYHRTTFAVN